MPLIRLQDKVPEVYVNQSRDFQLFLRLYDVLVNGLKYDIDGVSRLINTKDCKSTMLQLLQTKLGFFSAKDFTDETLRPILLAFPALVKKKGTKSAIEEAVQVFLKINGLETKTKIDIIEDKPTVQEQILYGVKVKDHSVVIGIESQVKDVTPLKEMLKYIIPFGYNLYFYFFVGQETTDKYINKQKADILLVSNDINGYAHSYTGGNEEENQKYKAIFGEDWDNDKAWFNAEYSKKAAMENRLIASINTVEIEYNDENPTELKPKQEKEILEDVVSIEE